jgi:hypothetical protein
VACLLAGEAAVYRMALAARSAVLRGWLARAHEPASGWYE